MSERKACMLCFQYSDATDRAEMAEMERDALRTRCAELEKERAELRAKLQAAEQRAERAEAVLAELLESIEGYGKIGTLEMIDRVNSAKRLAKCALDAKEGA